MYFDWSCSLTLHLLPGDTTRRDFAHMKTFDELLETIIDKDTYW